MRDKLDPALERKHHHHAFEVYRDLGHGRSFREVARQVGSSPNSVGKWAKLYKWKGRIQEYSVVVAEKKKKGVLIKTDDPIVQKLTDAMERIEALINSAFTKDTVGNLSPIIKIKHVDDLTKLISEYRKFLETYHKFVAEYIPADKAGKRAVNIKEFNLNMGDLSQEERVKLMELIKNGNVPKRDKQPEGGVQDADFEQVPERGDEDGSGRDGVSGSTASSNSGDEKTVQ